MTAQALPYVILSGFLFGSTLIASRFSVGQFQPTTYIGLRLVLASLGHAVFYAFDRNRNWPTDRRLWRHAAVLGIFATAAPMTGLVSSLQYQSSGVTSVLITANPAMTVLMAHFFLPDESLTRRKSTGVVFAVGGALLLALRGETGLGEVAQANPIGYGLVLLSILSTSSATIYARRFMRQFDAFDVATVRMLVAALAVVPLSLLLIGFDLSAVDGRGYFALGYASLVGTFSGMMLAFYIIQRFGATASATTAYVIPIVAGLGGALVLDEQITVGMLVGMALIVTGIAILNQRRQPPDSSQLAAHPDPFIEK